MNQNIDKDQERDIRSHVNEENKENIAPNDQLMTPEDKQSNDSSERAIPIDFQQNRIQSGMSQDQVGSNLIEQPQALQIQNCLDEQNANPIEIDESQRPSLFNSSDDRQQNYTFPRQVLSQQHQFPEPFQVIQQFNIAENPEQECSQSGRLDLNYIQQNPQMGFCNKLMHEDADATMIPGEYTFTGIHNPFIGQETGNFSDLNTFPYQMIDPMQQKANLIQEVLPLKFEFQTWLRDSHGLFDYEGVQNQIQKQTLVASDMGSFFVVRKDQQIFIAPPTANINEFEDGEKITVLFKVACINGKYFIFHKDTLQDEDFCDTSHMIHYVVKDFKVSDIHEINGEVLQDQTINQRYDGKQCVIGGHYLNNFNIEDNVATLSQNRHAVTGTIPHSQSRAGSAGSPGLQYPFGMMPSSKASGEGNSYIIRQGDIIKFGRISYKVTQLHLPQQEIEDNDFSQEVRINQIHDGSLNARNYNENNIECGGHFEPEQNEERKVNLHRTIEFPERDEGQIEDHHVEIHAHTVQSLNHGNDTIPQIRKSHAHLIRQGSNPQDRDQLSLQKDEFDQLEIQDSLNQKTPGMSQQYLKSLSAKSMPVCRICLSELEDDPIKNPLISPCKCKGTMSVIHIKCLRFWLDSKKETRVSESTQSFQWTIIRCELCHSVYPMDYQIDGNHFKLFDYELPLTDTKDAFVVFETVYQQKEVKTIHVVSSKDTKSATIGRAFDAGMRVPDISVSRYHAIIEYKDSQFQIRDNNSKFGTLLLLKQPLIIDPKIYQKDAFEKKIQIEVGRTVITISCQKNEQQPVRAGRTRSVFLNRILDCCCGIGSNTQQHTSDSVSSFSQESSLNGQIDDKSANHGNEVIDQDKKKDNQKKKKNSEEKIGKKTEKCNFKGQKWRQLKKSLLDQDEMETIFKNNSLEKNFSMNLKGFESLNQSDFNWAYPLEMRQVANVWNARSIKKGYQDNAQRKTCSKID